MLKTLPKKHDQIVHCDITSDQEDFYSDILEDLARIKGNEGNGISWIMQMRQVSNHSLLYRHNFNDDKLHEVAKILCRQVIVFVSFERIQMFVCFQERQYRTKKPEHVAEDFAFLTDIQINLICKKFDSLKSFVLDARLALNSGKCKQLDVMIPKILEKVASDFAFLLLEEEEKKKKKMK